jgi:hypothetical protein
MDKEAPIATVQTAQAGLANTFPDNIKADRKENNLIIIKIPYKNGLYGEYIKNKFKNQVFY